MPSKILIVEDDREIRETLVEVLGDRGYAAVGAADGKEALDQLRDPTADPDDRWCMVLLDLMMPGMDGRTFRKEQLLDPMLSSIPVVVLSATHDLDRAAAELGVNGYATKPLGLSKLLGIVKQYYPCTPVPPTTS